MKGPILAGIAMDQSYVEVMASPQYGGYLNS
jgi:hypothetical protein